jgi:hypothetical protein
MLLICYSFILYIFLAGSYSEGCVISIPFSLFSSPHTTNPLLLNFLPPSLYHADLECKESPLSRRIKHHTDISFINLAAGKLNYRYVFIDIDMCICKFMYIFISTCKTKFESVSDIMCRCDYVCKATKPPNSYP